MPPKSPRRFKFSENALDGEILLEGLRLRVLFRFAPERVAFIKSIKGSRYDAATKTWTIPRERYESIQQSSLFAEDRYPRRFSESDLAHSLEQLEELRQSATAAYRNNPFAVAAAHLPYLSLDVVFRLSNEMPQLRAQVRFGSKAAPILTRMKGAHFLRSEGLFAVPAGKLPALLGKLRDKNFSFAVEAESGSRLKESAELRKRILLEPGRAAPQELEQAILTPYLDFAETDGDLAFMLKYATSRHLATLFPDDENFHSRKRKSLALTEQDLLTLLNRTQSLDYPLYITRGVHSHLERRGLQFDEAVESGNIVPSEEILPYLKTPCAWVVLAPGRAGLIIDDSLSKQPALEPHVFEKLANKRFYTAPESALFALYQALRPAIAAKETETFSTLITDLAQRLAARATNESARASSDATVPANLFSDAGLVKKLFPHQRVAVQWLAAREYAMLGDDMGLGKTLSVLATIDLLLKDDTIQFALVVCPNSLVRNWLREAARFTPQRSFHLLPDAPAERKEFLRAVRNGTIHCDVLVVNYERMRRPDVHAALTQLLQERPTLICCDESQRVKNARSQTFLALKELALLCKRRFVLTGTPTPRDITDIWSQVQLLDFGKRFGSNYVKWLKSVAELGTQYSDFAVRKFKVGAVEAIISRVHELLLRRKKEEVVSLPEKTFIDRNCKLGGTQASRYKEICEQLLLRIGTLSGGSFIKQIDNVLEEYLRAVQIASNPRLVDPTWLGEPAKFTELDAIVDEIVRERGEKMVIWTNFLGNVDEVLERYKDLGIKPYTGAVTPRVRDETIEAFQTGPDIKILVAIPAAGGVGITLTAAQTAVYLDKSWNAEHWLQSVDRLHRIGQRGSVNIISLAACKVDELITKNLIRKGRAQAQLLGDNKEPVAPVGYPTREELIEALSDDIAPEEIREDVVNASAA